MLQGRRRRQGRGQGGVAQAKEEEEEGVQGMGTGVRGPPDPGTVSGVVVRGRGVRTEERAASSNTLASFPEQATR